MLTVNNDFFNINIFLEDSNVGIQNYFSFRRVVFQLYLKNYRISIFFQTINIVLTL